MDKLIIPYPDFQMGELIDPEQHDINNRYIVNKANELVDTLNVINSNGGANAIGLTPPEPFTSATVQALFNELVARLKNATATTSGASLIATPTLVKLAGNSVEAQLKALDTLLQSAHVATANIANGAVTTEKIADLNVTTTKLSDGAITTSKMADGVVVTPKIVDGSVTNPKLAINSVSSDKMQDGAVSETKIATNAVGTNHMKDASVTSTKISDRSITSPKIGTQAVKQEHLDPSLLTALPNSLLSAKVTALENEMDVAQLEIYNLNGAFEEYAGNEAVKIGNLTALNTTNKSSVVGAVNEVNTKAGTLTSLTTTAKGNLVSAVNEVNAKTQVATVAEAIVGNDYNKIMSPFLVKMANTIAVNGDNENLDTTLVPFMIKRIGDFYFYVETKFYNEFGSAQKMQRITTYNGVNPDTKVRHCYSNVWSDWSPSIQDLKSGAVSVKTQVASAITAKGVPTEATATGAQMASNIGQINTGVAPTISVSTGELLSVFNDGTVIYLTTSPNGTITSYSPTGVATTLVTNTVSGVNGCNKSSYYKASYDGLNITVQIFNFNNVLIGSKTATLPSTSSYAMILKVNHSTDTLFACYHYEGKIISLNLANSVVLSDTAIQGSQYQGRASISDDVYGYTHHTGMTLGNTYIINANPLVSTKASKQITNLSSMVALSHSRIRL